MADEKDIKKNSNAWDRIKSFGKKATLSSLLTIQSLTGLSANAQQNPQPDNETNAPQQEVVIDSKKDNINPNDKYMTDITVRNDTVNYVTNTGALYSEQHGEIRIMKSDENLNDIVFNKSSKLTPEEIIIIHEREHEIDIEEKGIGKEIVSLNQYYQREYHIEVAALIAEKLEIRRQFMEAKTEEDKKNFFEKFDANPENIEYVRALKNGLLNPNSNNPQDFIKEMAFIKNSSTKYRCDPYDNGYIDVITNNSIIYLKKNGNKIKDNPVGFEKEINAIYQIGGFDFTSVGNNDLYPMKNNGLEYADKLLEQGADTNKLAKFINKIKSNSDISNHALKWAENFDVTGLSREQAETVLQTAIIAQESAVNIAESICLGNGYNDEFRIYGGTEEMAMYLDIKGDIWKKNGTLSQNGNEEKFNNLMKDVKNVEVDCIGWLESVQNILAATRDPFKNADLKKIAKENQGRIVNVDDYYTELKLPLNGISVESVLENMKIKEEADKKYWQEYFNNQPQKAEQKERLSTPYQTRVLDLQSSILADELNQKIEYDRQQLREELKQQEGEFYDTPQMKSQDMKIDIRIKQRPKEGKENKDNLSERKTDTKSNITSIPQRDFSL